MIRAALPGLAARAWTCLALLAASLLPTGAQATLALFNANCATVGCHTSPPTTGQAPTTLASHPLAAAGNRAIIEYARDAGMAPLVGVTPAQLDSIATYLAGQLPAQSPSGEPIAFNTQKTFSLPDMVPIPSPWGGITSIVTVSSPTKGSVSYNASGQAIYTPTAGQSGADTWTYRGSGPAGLTSIRTARVVIATPPPPVVTSASTTGQTGVPFSFQVVASNSPTSFNASGLPTGLSISSSGLITGTPSGALGPYPASVTATNAGGTSAPATITITLSQGPPVMGGANTATGAEGVVFAGYQIVATNGTITGYTASGLPPGLTLNPATGLISGTPTVTAGPYPRIYNVTVGASNGVPPDGSKSVTFTINKPVPTIDSAATATGFTGVAFSYQITGTNGPLTAFTATALPAGLSLNTSSGLISGTPTTVGGPTPVTLTATNSSGTSANFTLNITVDLGPPVITSAATMPPGGEGNVYTGYTITATNPPHTSFGATGLPAGLSVNPSTGVISGTPAPGSGAGSPYTVTVSATNSNSTGSRTVTLVISQVAPVIAAPASVNGQTGVAFSYQIVAANGPTSYGATGLPPGLTVNTTNGLISGTPTTVGTFNGTMSATNGSGTDAKALTITITLGPPVITSGASASGAAGFPFSYQIAASNSPTSYGASGLPAGVTVNTTTGLISGTPAANGVYNATVTATNATGTGSRAVTITIAFGIPVVNSASSALAATGANFSYQITATNGPTSFGASGLPAGLLVDAASGLISGVASAPGTFTVTLTASNATGTGSATLILTVSLSAPVVTSALSVAGAAGTPLNYIIQVVNGPVSMSVSGLPPGLSFDASGSRILGTPTRGGTYPVVINVSNITGSATFTVVFSIGFQLASVQDVAVEVVYETARAIALPVSGDYTYITIVTLPEHGLVTLQGATVTYAPALGYFGEDSFTYTATNPAGTTPAATVRINVGTLVPIASAASMTVSLNTPATADLARFVRASGLTGVSIGTQPAHGTVTVNGTSVTYTPRTNFFGADSFTYIAFGNAGKSAPALVSVSVVGRPNPADDPDVAGLVDSQVQAARRFSGAQIGNFQRRMETLHRGRDVAPRATEPTASAPVAAPTPAAARAPEETEAKPARVATTGLIPTSLFAPLASVATTRTLDMNGSSGDGRTGGGFTAGTNVWIAGTAHFGRRDADGETSGLRFSTDGVSLGVDRRFSERLVLGLGIGYGRDETKVGTGGTLGKARGQSFALYGSFQPSVQTFVDMLVGVGKLDFDSSRYVAVVDQIAMGSRRGDQAFGSLAAGAEFGRDGVTISPYGRIDLTSDRLKAYSESGAGLYSLTYHEQRLRSSQLAMGVRAESVHEADFGRVIPRFRVEYRRQLEGQHGATVSYADLFNNAQEYSLGTSGTGRNALLLGVGSDFLLRGGLKLGIDYQAQRGSGSSNVQAVRLLVSQDLDGRGLPSWSWQPKMFKDPIGLEFGFSYDDNVTRGRLDGEKLADRVFTLSVGEPIPLKLGNFRNVRFLLTPAVTGEKFERYAGLGRFSAGLQAEVQYRASGAFDATTYSLVGRASYDQFESDRRTGPRYFLGVNARRSLTDRIDVFAEVGANARNGRSDVFRTRDYAAKLNLDYSLGKRGVLYLAGEYRRGDTVSTGAASLVNVGLSEVFVADDAFDGHDFFAYRFDARTVLGTIGWNLPLGPRDSLDFSLRRIQGTPIHRPSFDGAGSLRYIDNQYSIVYLMRF